MSYLQFNFCLKNLSLLYIRSKLWIEDKTIKSFLPFLMEKVMAIDMAKVFYHIFFTIAFYMVEFTNCPKTFDNLAAP